MAIKQAAVSITHGSASFYSNLADGRLGTGNQLSSLTRRNPNISREYTVETVPLAAEVPPHANITLLKIDVEGNEPLVFASAAPVLPRTRLVQFECGGFAAQPALGYPQTQPLRSIVEFLARRGFHTFRLSAARLLRMDGPFWLPSTRRAAGPSSTASQSVLKTRYTRLPYGPRCSTALAATGQRVFSRKKWYRTRCNSVL